MSGPLGAVGRKRIRNAAAALLIGFVLAAGATELGLRFLLFGESSIARGLGAEWRKAERYADPRSEDDHWKLQDRFLDPELRAACPNPDPVCGWTGPIDPRTYLPAKPIDLKGRRPVLLYGDSFAQCFTSTEQCFQTLLEKSDLADRFCLVNYGVGGYGVDQEYLLLKQSIDRWKDLAPIVVVSFLVDEDFYRNLLTFRGWPKPRLRIDGDELVADGPLVLDQQEFLERNPIGIRSYLWRFLIFRRGFLPARVQTWLRPARVTHAEVVALAQKLLEEIHRELESRGLEHFFLVFNGWHEFESDSEPLWAEDLVERTGARLGVRVISTRPFLLAAADGVPSRVQAGLFLGRVNGHYNEFGNIAAFEAMRQGIEGR